MKSDITIHVNDDDSLTVIAAVPVSTTQAKLWHTSFMATNIEGALKRIGDEIENIKAGYAEARSKKPNLSIVN